MIQNPKIGVMGAGSIGCYLGACLIEAGFDLVLIGRAGLKDEIQKTGRLKITSFHSDALEVKAEKIHFTEDLNQLKHCDLVLITLKSGNTEEVSSELAQILKPESVALSFQNGVRNAETIRNHLKEQVVLAGMVPYNVVKTGDATFHNGTSGELMIEKKEGISETILKVFQKAGLEISSHPNIQGVLWGKLLFNLNNAVNALAGIPLKEELSDPGYRKIVARAIREGLRVLKKANIRVESLGKMIPTLAPFILSLPNFLYFRLASAMVKIDPQARSSMWEDLQKGRKTEIDYLNAEIVRLGEKHQVPTPVNSCIVGLINETEEKQQGSPRLKPEEIWNKVQKMNL